MSGKLRRFLADENGATAAEYAIMVAGLAVLIIAGVFLLGTRITTLFTRLRSRL